jgi:hypothetical protein
MEQDPRDYGTMSVYCNGAGTITEGTVYPKSAWGNTYYPRGPGRTVYLKPAGGKFLELVTPVNIERFGSFSLQGAINSVGCRGCPNSEFLEGVD